MAACPAIKYGWAHTKVLERAKFLALLNSKGNYNKEMVVTAEATPSPVEIPYPGCRDYIRETYARRSFPEEGIAGILASISEQTLKQYDCAYKAWWYFA
ncbi:unnamed protein product [Callosobruchus maculatus]|uniref:Uncharacterized protein n=1 Tax=Callosobruchus maculatus TaxID=64391 RepID=A0A653CRW5_CALMS|nr:unnamed protein product [Callosobruchus maculatus]